MKSRLWILVWSVSVNLFMKNCVTADNSIVTNNFPSLSTILSNKANTTVTPGRQYIFPHIEFNCDAYITKWIYRGRLRDDSVVPIQQYPIFQVWGDGIIIIADYIRDESTDYDDIVRPLQETKDGLIIFTPQEPVKVDDDSILGIYIPENPTDIYFDENPFDAREYFFQKSSDELLIFQYIFSENERIYIPQVTVELSTSSSILSSTSSSMVGGSEVIQISTSLRTIPVNVLSSSMVGDPQLSTSLTTTLVSVLVGVSQLSTSLTTTLVSVSSSSVVGVLQLSTSLTTRLVSVSSSSMVGVPQLSTTFITASINVSSTTASSRILPTSSIYSQLSPSTPSSSSYSSSSSSIASHSDDHVHFLTEIIAGGVTVGVLVIILSIFTIIVCVLIKILRKTKARVNQQELVPNSYMTARDSMLTNVAYYQTYIDANHYDRLMRSNSTQYRSELVESTPRSSSGPDTIYVLNPAYSMSVPERRFSQSLPLPDVPHSLPNPYMQPIPLVAKEYEVPLQFACHKYEEPLRFTRHCYETQTKPHQFKVN